MLVPWQPNWCKSGPESRPVTLSCAPLLVQWDEMAGQGVRQDPRPGPCWGKRREEHSNPSGTGLTTAELPPYSSMYCTTSALSHHKHHSSLSGLQWTAKPVVTSVGRTEDFGLESAVWISMVTLSLGPTTAMARALNCYLLDLEAFSLSQLHFLLCHPVLILFGLLTHFPYFIWNHHATVHIYFQG